MDSSDKDFAALPSHAQERLVEMRGRDEAHRLFTSDLSTSEFLLVKEAGFDPIGLVVGSSIYHVGFQQAAWSQNQEMTVLTQAMYHARELAMTRMEEEAHALGADGIVGVRLEVNHKEWGQHVAEFVAIGTAVVHRDDPHRFKNKEGRPFTLTVGAPIAPDALAGEAVEVIERLKAHVERIVPRDPDAPFA